MLVIWKERANPFCARADARSDVMSSPADRSLVRPQVAGKLADERGLARAVGADHGMRFSLAHIEFDAIACAQGAEALRKPANVQQHLIHRALPG